MASCGHLVWPLRVCDPDVMTLEDATKAYRRAEHTLEQRRTQLAEAIADAARAGTKPAEIVRVTGYAREHVRRILRAAGIEG